MKLRWVLLGLLGMLMLSCTHPPSVLRIKHLKDASFRLVIWPKGRAVLPRPASKTSFDLLNLYRSSDRLLYSKCRNYPSDSHYLTLLLDSGCSPWTALFRASGRTLREHDLAIFQQRIPVYYAGRLVWLDMPPTCH